MKTKVVLQAKELKVKEISETAGFDAKIDKLRSHRLECSKTILAKLEQEVVIPYDIFSTTLS